MLAGLGVVRHDGAAPAPVATGEPQYDLPVCDQRRVAVAQAGGVVARAHLPALLAGLRVEGDQHRVGRAEVDRVAEHGDTPVPAERLRLLDVLGIAARIHPGDVARQHVEGGDPAAALRDVHQPVGHDRRRHPAAVVAHRPGPDQAQVGDVAAVDLVERAEPGDVVGPAVAHPVAVLRIEQPLLGDRLPLGVVVGLPQRGAGLHEEETGQANQHESAASMISHRLSPCSHPAPRLREDRRFACTPGPRRPGTARLVSIPNSGIMAHASDRRNSRMPLGTPVDGAGPTLVASGSYWRPNRARPGVYAGSAAPSPTASPLPSQ